MINTLRKLTSNTISVQSKRAMFYGNIPVWKVKKNSTVVQGWLCDVLEDGQLFIYTLVDN